jgi:hypothetical protein
VRLKLAAIALTSGLACACGTDRGAGPSGAGPSPVTNVSGTWTGTEQFLPQQSTPAGQCIVDYFRATPAVFSTPVSLTLSQTGITVTGQYSGADVVAFRPFTCDLQGTVENGALTLSFSQCSSYTFGLRQDCFGTLRRRDGRFSVSTASATFVAQLQMTVDGEGPDGTSLGTVNWFSAITLRR